MNLLLLFSSLAMFNSLQSHRQQHARLPCPSLSPGICSNSFIESMMPSSHLNLCHPPSPPALSLSQHQGLFQQVGSSHQVAKVYEPVATNTQAITITNYFTQKNQTWFQDVLKSITYNGGKKKKTLNERNCVYNFCLKCTGNPEHCIMSKTVNKWLCLL